MTQDSRPLRPSGWWNLAVLAVAVGLAAGFVEVAVTLWRVAIVRTPVWHSSDFGWLTPMSWVMLMMIPGVLASLAGAVVRFRWLWPVPCTMSGP